MGNFVLKNNIAGELLNRIGFSGSLFGIMFLAAICFFIPSVSHASATTTGYVTFQGTSTVFFDWDPPMQSILPTDTDCIGDPCILSGIKYFGSVGDYTTGYYDNVGNTFTKGQIDGACGVGKTFANCLATTQFIYTTTTVTAAPDPGSLATNVYDMLFLIMSSLVFAGAFIPVYNLTKA